MLCLKLINVGNIRFLAEHAGIDLQDTFLCDVTNTTTNLCKNHKLFLSTNLCRSSTIMKRTASHCPICSQKLGQGFAFINHKRLCTLRIKVNQQAQQQDNAQHREEREAPLESAAHADDQEDQHQDQDIVPEDQDIGPQDPDINPIAQLPQLTQRKRLFRKLSPEVKEAMEFLAMCDTGEGCSREMAQAFLNYHRRKGGPSARLLPKDVRTCWSRVEQVSFMLRTLMCAIDVSIYVCKKCVFYACILCVNLCVHFMFAFYVCILCVNFMCGKCVFGCLHFMCVFKPNSRHIRTCLEA
jgi:hypothetical protein